MWPAESIMQSMRPAMLCRFPIPALADFTRAMLQFLYADTNLYNVPPKSLTAIMVSILTASRFFSFNK